MRIASPHEKKQTIEEFLDDLDSQIAGAWRSAWRVNLACAVQPHSTGITPDIATICEVVNRELWPERIRVVQIDPRQDGQRGMLLKKGDVDRIRDVGGELITMDAHRSRSGLIANGLALADFFDFT